MDNLNVRDLAISPGYTSDQTLFTATDGGGIYKSTNSGGSWSATNTGLPHLGVNRLVLSPNYITNGTIYAAFSLVYVSTDRGSTWSNLGSIPWGGRYVQALNLTPGNLPKVFAGIDGESLWRFDIQRFFVYLPVAVR
jgi:hypothetical protein